MGRIYISSSKHDVALGHPEGRSGLRGVNLGYCCFWWVSTTCNIWLKLKSLNLVSASGSKDAQAFPPSSPTPANPFWSWATYGNFFWQPDIQKIALQCDLCVHHLANLEEDVVHCCDAEADLRHAQHFLVFTFAHVRLIVLVSNSPSHHPHIWYFLPSSSSAPVKTQGPPTCQGRLWKKWWEAKCQPWHK